MEENEKDHIIKHLPQLIDTTEVTPALLAYLLQDDIIAKDDVHTLEVIQVRNDRAFKLYELLQTRTSAFSAMTKALHKTGQSGAFQVLATFHKNSSSDNSGPIYSKGPSGLQEFLEMSSSRSWRFWEANQSTLIISSEAPEVTLRKILDTSKSLVSLEESMILQYDFTASDSKTVVVNCVSHKPRNILTQLKPFPEKLILITYDKPEALHKTLSLLKIPSKYQITLDHFEWDDLTEEFQKEILSRQVTLSKSKQITLQDVCDLVPDKALALLSQIRGQFLLSLINNMVPSLLHSTIPKPLKYYVPRATLSRSRLSKRVLTSSAHHILVFTGIEWYELSDLVQPSRTDISSNQINSALTVRHIVLQQKSDFDKICSKTQLPVHWLHYEGLKGTFILIKSRGSMRTIQGVVHEDQDDFDEDPFLHHITNSIFIDQSSSPVCISDKPGMGKSELLARLGRQLEMDTIVVFLVMGEFVAKISSHLNKKDLPEVILDVLVSSTCSNEFSAEVLKIGLQTGSVKVALLLDGYDEVHSSNLELAATTLKTIKYSCPSIKLFVTTRPHLLNDLEETLGVLGFNIQPFTGRDQVIFLVSCWIQSEDKIKLDPKRLRTFAELCLKVVKDKMTDKDQDIAGIPLQCLLIADVFEEEALQFGNSFNVISAQAAPELKTNSITGLFQRLIQKKLDTFAAKHSKTFDKHLCSQVHALEAIRLLFPEEYPKLQRNPEIPVEDLLKIGLLEGTSTSDLPRFIHRTFAEYFVAWFLAEVVTKVNTSFAPKNVKILCQKVLATFEDKSKHVDGIFVPFVFKNQVICYFFNSLVEVHEGRNRKLVEFLGNQGEVSFKHLSIACAYHDFVFIFRYLFHHHAFASQEKEIFDNKLLSITTLKSSFPMFEIVADQYKTWSGKTLKDLRFEENEDEEEEVSEFDMYSIMLAAVSKGKYAVVEYLLQSEGFRELVEASKIRGLLHYCVAESSTQLDSVIDQKIQILNVLLKIDPDLIEEDIEDAGTALQAPGAHHRLLIELIKMGANLESKKGDGNILHVAAKKLEAGAYHELISFLEGHSEEVLKSLVKGRNKYNETPLISALTGGVKMELEDASVDIFARCGADFNAKGDYESTALCSAIQSKKSVRVLKRLVHHGASWRDIDWLGSTALHVAAEKGTAEAIQYFVGIGVDVNARDVADRVQEKQKKMRDKHRVALRDRENSGGNTAVQLLMQNWGVDHLDLVKLLISAGADLGIVNEDFETPLHFAVRNSSVDVAKLLCLKGQSVNARDIHLNTPLLEVMKNKRENVADIVKLLKKHNADMTTTTNGGETMLHVAAAHGTLATVRFLVEEMGMDVKARDDEGNTVLHHSVLGWVRDKVSITAYLAEKFEDTHPLNRKGVTPLVKLMMTKNRLMMSTELVRPLLRERNEGRVTEALKELLMQDWGVDEESSRTTRDIATLLVEHGADIRHRDEGGNTLLHACARFGNYFGMVYLLERGLEEDIDVRNDGMETPLHVVNMSYLETQSLLGLSTLRLLVQAGGDANAVKMNGESVLHGVVKKGVVEAVQLLLKQGVSPNVVDGGENTPLLEALMLPVTKNGKQFKIVSTLIENGADANITNGGGLTALEQGLKEGCRLEVETVELLESKGCLGKSGELIEEVMKNVMQRFVDVSENQEKLVRILEKIVKIKSSVIGVTDEEGRSVLYYAVKGGALDHLNHLKTVDHLKKLVRLGAPWNGVDNSLQNMLHHSAQTGNLGVFQYFITLGCDLTAKDQEGQTPLHLAATGMTPDDLQGVLEHLVKIGRISVASAVDKRGVSVVHRAVAQQEVLGSSLELLSKAVDFNFKDGEGNSGIVYGVLGGRSKSFLEGLMEFTTTWRGTSANERGVLHHCAASGNREALELFLAEGEDVNAQDANGDTPLHCAFRKENLKTHEKDNVLKMVQNLMEHGADINVTNSSGSTPLHLPPEPKQLTATEFQKLFEFLISLGKPLPFHSRDSEGRTPLHLAALHNELHENTLDLLASYAVDFSAVDQEGNSVLHYSVLGRRSRVFLENVMRLGADPGVRNGKGRSPLHCAVEVGNLPAARVFIKRGCDVNEVDKEGNSLMQVVERCREGREEVVQLLREAGGGDVTK